MSERDVKRLLDECVRPLLDGSSFLQGDQCVVGVFGAFRRDGTGKLLILMDAPFSGSDVQSILQPRDFLITDQRVVEVDRPTHGSASIMSAGFSRSGSIILDLFRAPGDIILKEVVLHVQLPDDLQQPVPLDSHSEVTV
jgi:hypothetical protein